MSGRRIVELVTVGFLAVLLTGLPWVGTAVATLPGDNGELLIHGVGPDGDGLYAVDLATGTLDRLPVDIGELGDLSWSPDGTRIAMTWMEESESTGRDVWMMNADGSELRLFAEASPDESLEYVTWSPDGNRIAVSANRTCQDIACIRGEFLLVYDLAGRKVEERDLGLIPYTISALEWSPGGGELLLGLFWYPADDVRNIGTYDLSTSQLSVIAPGAAPSWSPDGSSIAFVHFEGEDSGDTVATAVMNADGSDLREYPSLTGTWGNQGAVVGWRPQWSPDGTRIALIVGWSGPETVHTMAPDGAEYLTHALGMTYVSGLWWQPTRPVSGFHDVPDDHLYSGDVAWLLRAGITRGCDPPINRTFCPDRPVTRGEVAAFLVRTFRLTASLDDPFIDDDHSVFEADIEKLAAAGVTRGCNPPLNDRFCPAGNVTRGEVAAFLVRALHLAEDDGRDRFTDDDHSVFESDIEKLAAAGITRGCNPPSNDRFCPDRSITRGQMAALLHRAAG